MKIIAERNGPSIHRTLILEADESEVARLLGYYSHYGAQEHGVLLKPGDVVQVHAMYDRLEKLDADSVELGKAIAKLRDIADHLEPLQPLIRATAGHTDDSQPT